MSALSFLFQGQAPQSVTNYGSSAANIPTWLQQYTQGILAQSAALASQPYQTYQGPRIAGFTDAQQKAQGAVGALQGAYQPALSQAEQMTTQGSNPAAIGGALSTLPQAQNYIQSAVAPTTAQMNPYTNNVINQAKDQATQYWQDQLQPSINAQFTASGNFGSAANQRAQELGAKEVTQNIQDTSQSALSQAYQNAQQTGLQAASQTGALSQIQGGLGYEQGVLGLQGAGQLGSLANLGQNLGLQGAGALNQIGGEQQNQNQQNLSLGYQDFLNQQQYPYQQASWLSQQVGGTATPTTVPTSNQTSQTGYAPAYGASPASQAIGMYNILNPTGSHNARGGSIRRRRGGPIASVKRGRPRGALETLQRAA